MTLRKTKTDFRPIPVAAYAVPTPVFVRKPRPIVDDTPMPDDPPPSAYLAGKAKRRFIRQLCLDSDKSIPMSPLVIDELRNLLASRLDPSVQCRLMRIYLNAIIDVHDAW